MAANKSKPDPTDPLADPMGDGALDQAIDDLRGVLKADETGGLPDLGIGGDGDFGSDLGDFGDIGSGPADTFGDFGGGMGNDFASDATNDFGSGFGDAGTTHQAPGSALDANLDLIMDIPIDVQIILGSSRMQVSGLMNLSEGATIPLDRKIGEPVEIVVNGRLIGRGEITVLEGDETRFGVKLIEVNGKTKG